MPLAVKVNTAEGELAVGSGEGCGDLQNWVRNAELPWLHNFAWGQACGRVLIMNILHGSKVI